jgi:enamine deaminase RidA (YjgF/YER057c/UK114 family)
MLFLSGTASVDEHGRSVHPGDFEAQCLRTLRNLTRLLASEGASWHDVVRTTCYLRDISRDYDAFNEVRTMFLRHAAVHPLPASTAIEARICRPELLVEIEAIAIAPRE